MNASPSNNEKSYIKAKEILSCYVSCINTTIIILSIVIFTDSPWREYLSNEIIFFQENQKIQKLYTKWWKEKSGGKCNIEEPKKSSALEVSNVGGVFVVLIGGMVVGFLIALIEFMWKAWKNARVDKVRFAFFSNHFC